MDDMRRNLLIKAFKMVEKGAQQSSSLVYENEPLKDIWEEAREIRTMINMVCSVLENSIGLENVRGSLKSMLDEEKLVRHENGDVNGLDRVDD